MKWQRRKQPNRESARRSRLHKQAESEILAKSVRDLSTENSELKEENGALRTQMERLRAENLKLIAKVGGQWGDRGWGQVVAGWGVGWVGAADGLIAKVPLSWVLNPVVVRWVVGWLVWAGGRGKLGFGWVREWLGGGRRAQLAAACKQGAW